MAYVYGIAGMEFTDGLLGAGLIRAIHLLVSFGLAPFFTYALLSKADVRLASLLAGGRQALRRPPHGEGPEAG